MYFTVMINKPWQGAEGQGRADLITGNKKTRLLVILILSVLNMSVTFYVLLLANSTVVIIILLPIPEPTAT